MVDKFDKNSIEKNDLPDSNEGKETVSNFKDKFHELKHKSDNFVNEMKYKGDNLTYKERFASSITDLYNEIHKKLLHDETSPEFTNKPQEEKRVVQNHYTVGNVSIPHQVAQTIEQNSEDPMSIPGRNESFAQVQSFTNSIGVEEGFFGRLVRFLS